MENYSKDQLINLTQHTASFHSLIQDSSSWVKRNLELDEKDTVLNQLHEAKSEIAILRDSIETRPVFALFGVSQVGKSYLVKNLLSIDGQNLEIELPNKQRLDFLQSINPKGDGTEATGVVSRFTTETTYINPEFPILVKLLDVKDIILILCDSFFIDITKLDYYPSIQDFDAHSLNIKNSIQNKVVVQTAIHEDDIFYLKKYFESFLERKNPMASHVSKSKFWIELTQVIAYIEPAKWGPVFGVLWSNDPHFTELFEKLVKGLECLSFHNSIFVNKEAILRDQGKILDIIRVSGIYSTPENTTILLNTNQEIEFNLFMLSALTAEITMPVSPEIAEKKAFLKQTDLLDFPGARSRKFYEKEEIKKEIIPELLLRGKISYLFNKYSSNYEINNLLFCIKNWNNEVTEIPLLINDWIKRNVGENSEKREKRIGKNGTNPLFVVLTFYNQTIQYNANSDKDDLSEKWDKRFIKLFKEETVTKSNDWDVNWTTSEPNFKSFYPLRDYQFSSDVFTGFLTEGKETGINPERQAYYERLNNSFINFPYIKEHFHNPSEAWDACSTPNKDGSERISNDLYPAANNLIKTKNYINQLIDFKQIVIDALGKFHKSDDISEQRENAIREGILIQNALTRLFGSGSKFGEFLTKLHLSNTEVYNFIHQNYLPASNNHNPSIEEVIIRTYSLDSAESVDFNKEILRNKLFLNSLEEVNDWLERENLDLENVLKNVHITAASILVDGILEMWKKQLDPSLFKEYEMEGLDLSIIKLINDNLYQTFEIFDVRKELIYLFEKKTRMLRVSNDTDEFLASIITSYINDFVSNYGFNFMKDDRKNQVLELALSKSMNLEALMDRSNKINETNLCDLFEEEDSSNQVSVTFPSIDHFKSFVTKIQLILLSNCGFRKYNVEENKILETLIEKIETLQFE